MLSSKVFVLIFLEICYFDGWIFPFQGTETLLSKYVPQAKFEVLSLLCMMGRKAELWDFPVLKGEIAIECKPSFIINLLC